jgi:predicted cytidylate kinase
MAKSADTSNESAYVNIALSGDVGTGTTTLGRNLASSLGWNHVNAGDYFRSWHRERGIPLEDVQDIPEEVDREIDDKFRTDMAVLAQTVFESHLAGWLARDSPQTFKILCVADPSVTMPRIASREGWSVEEAAHFSQLRSQRLNEKFAKLYDVSDPYDPSFFDVVIDTTNLSVGEVLDRTLRQFLHHIPEGYELAKVLELD